MRTSDSTSKLVEALVAARAEFTPVLRDAVGHVGQDRLYRYADLSSVLEAIQPALLKHALLVVQPVDAELGMLITRVIHISGEWIESTYPLKLELPPQQLGASLTYGRRYSLQSLLCLAAADEDDAVPAPPPTKAKGKGLTQAQRKRMFAIATKAGWTTAQMKAYLQQAYNVESSQDLPTIYYDQVCADFEHPPGAEQDI